MICAYCNKKPDELSEYVAVAKLQRMTPDEYVQKKEGTYNPANGHFCCTMCYMKIGMPSRLGGWKAP